jgi:predicted site-specific integrase-resolvase
MKSCEVLKLLGVTRVTLMNYVKSGKIKATKMSNGLYDYNAVSVYEFLGVKNKSNVIYARVSTNKQKNDLSTQINNIQSYCDKNKIKIDKVYSEIESGISLDRSQLQLLLDDIIAGKINNIYISYKDRLSRLSFHLLEQIFKKFGTNVIVISKLIHKHSNKNDDAELFEDLLSLTHYFSTKLYSSRKHDNLI